MSLSAAFSPENLRLAWRWTRSNPDAEYKSYFQDLYKAYALADEAYLTSLGERLRTDRFRPGHSTKLYYPKPSGLLRTYTLLDLEDQIAYQALVNIVAERLFPHVRRRYGREVFGHLYAGKASTWFYRKWSTGYRQFNDAVRDAVASGHIFTATFDLTAFYDSLDHGVLRHFLEHLGLDRDFIHTLLGWLEHWTASGERIYHGHGIPQGPLPSGLLSEVVLQYFDAKKRIPRGIRYLRYVDDIRLYGKSADVLRQALLSFDYLSKFLGLFPKGSKVEVRTVHSIQDELKSISRPPERVLRSRAVNQRQLRKRLTALSPRHEVTNPTRFKYLLAHAQPHSALSLRLLRILERQPELYQSVFRYFEKYDTISAKVSGELYRHLRIGPVYFSYKAALLKSICGRVHPRYRWRLSATVTTMWRERRKYRHAADLREALLRWMIQEHLLKYRSIHTILCGEVVEPWVRASIALRLDHGDLGTPSYQGLLNDLLQSPAADPAVVAGFLLLREGLQVRARTREMNHVAYDGMRVLGVVRGRARPPSLLPGAMEAICGRQLPGFDWRVALGTQHRHIEGHALVVSAYGRTDMTAFVNGLDVLNDLLLDVLVRHDRGIGKYSIGNIGGFIASGRSAFATRYPAFHALCVEVHELRKESALSHPIVRTSGRATGRIRFSKMRPLRRAMTRGYSEIIQTW